MKKRYFFYLLICLLFLFLIFNKFIEVYKEQKVRDQIDINEQKITDFIKNTNSGFKDYILDIDLLQEVEIKLNNKFDDLSYSQQYRIFEEFEKQYEKMLENENIKDIINSNDIDFDHYYPHEIKYSTDEYDYLWSENDLYVTNNMSYQASYDKEGNIIKSNNEYLQSEDLQRCLQGSREGSLYRNTCMNAFREKWSLEEGYNY